MAKAKKKSATRGVKTAGDAPPSIVADLLLGRAAARSAHVWMQHRVDADGFNPHRRVSPRVDDRLAAQVVPQNTKHGERSLWGKHEWAQYAVLALNLAKHVPGKTLDRLVNEWLDKFPPYCERGLGEISPSTIERAQETVRKIPPFEVN